DTDMVLIPGGTFVMGTDAETVPALQHQFNVRRRELFEAEIPAHLVTVAPFYMAAATWPGSSYPGVTSPPGQTGRSSVRPRGPARTSGFAVCGRRRRGTESGLVRTRSRPTRHASLGR